MVEDLDDYIVNYLRTVTGLTSDQRFLIESEAFDLYMEEKDRISLNYEDISFTIENTGRYVALGGVRGRVFEIHVETEKVEGDLGLILYVRKNPEKDIGYSDSVH